MMRLNLHHQQRNWSTDILRSQRQTPMARACRQLQQHYAKSAMQVCSIFRDPTSPIQASLALRRCYDSPVMRYLSVTSSKPPTCSATLLMYGGGRDTGVRAAWTGFCRPLKSWPCRHPSLSSVGIATPRGLRR